MEAVIFIAVHILRNGVLYFTFETNFGQWTASGSLEGDSLKDPGQLHDEFGRLRERR